MLARPPRSFRLLFRAAPPPLMIIGSVRERSPCGLAPSTGREVFLSAGAATRATRRPCPPPPATSMGPKGSPTASWPVLPCCDAGPFGVVCATVSCRGRGCASGACGADWGCCAAGFRGGVGSGGRSGPPCSGSSSFSGNEGGPTRSGHSGSALLNTWGMPPRGECCSPRSPGTAVPFIGFAPPASGAGASSGSANARGPGSARAATTRTAQRRHGLLRALLAPRRISLSILIPHETLRVEASGPNWPEQKCPNHPLRVFVATHANRNPNRDHPEPTPRKTKTHAASRSFRHAADHGEQARLRQRASGNRRRARGFG